MFFPKIKNVLISFVLIFLVFGSLVFIHYLSKTTEPYVDLSVRTPEIIPPDESGQNVSVLRFAVATMWSVESTFTMYRQLSERIAKDVGLQESLIIRSTYKALRQAIENNEIYIAFVCTGPYVSLLSRGHIKLLVTPEFVNGELYHSVIIVPSDSPINSVMDLKGKTLGCSDPESFTGYIIPFVMLKEQGINPDKFFKNIVFTGSHDRSIYAVDRGIVDAAAVHSIVWESAKRDDPSLKIRLKEIWQSDMYGPPPVIVSSNLKNTFTDSLKNAFLNLNKDPEGKKILAAIGIERFVPAKENEYISAVRLYKRYEKMRTIK